MKSAFKKTNYSGCGSPQNNNGSSVGHRHWDNKKKYSSVTPTCPHQKAWSMFSSGCQCRTQTKGDRSRKLDFAQVRDRLGRAFCLSRFAEPFQALSDSGSIFVGGVYNWFYSWVAISLSVVTMFTRSSRYGESLPLWVARLLPCTDRRCKQFLALVI